MHVYCKFCKHMQAATPNASLQTGVGNKGGVTGAFYVAPIGGFQLLKDLQEARSENCVLLVQTMPRARAERPKSLVNDLKCCCLLYSNVHGMHSLVAGAGQPRRWLRLSANELTSWRGRVLVATLSGCVFELVRHSLPRPFLLICHFGFVPVRSSNAIT